MLDQIIAERWVTPKATVGLWRCRREGDDVLVLAGNDWTRLPFLRQQVKKREGRPNMCLADFIAPDGEDWIGGFAVGIHGLEPHLERFKAEQRRLFGHLAEGARRPAGRKLRRGAARRGPQPPVGLCRRAFLQRAADPREISRDPPGARLSGLPRPQPEADPVRHARRRARRSHADREFRDAADLGGVGLLFRPPRQPVFRSRADRPGPARGLCRSGAASTSRRAERWLRPNLD